MGGPDWESTAELRRNPSPTDAPGAAQDFAVFMSHGRLGDLIRYVNWEARANLRDLHSIVTRTGRVLRRDEISRLASTASFGAWSNAQRR